MNRRETVGDGDPCPIEGHGRMYVYGQRQWCPHQSHDKDNSGWRDARGEQPAPVRPRTGRA